MPNTIWLRSVEASAAICRRGAFNSPKTVSARELTRFEASQPCPYPDQFSARKLDFGWTAPAQRLRACVVVPARNEEARLPALLTALAGQRDLAGAALPADTCEVLLLLNNCTDQTADIARAFQAAHPRFRLQIAEVDFPAEHAHVGRARQALFDDACGRFESLRRPSGLILTTDADSCPAPDWIAQTQAEIARGVAGVGGRIMLDPVEKAALPPVVSRLHVLDIGYRRALEELRALYAPEAHDPFPRHHQHFGGSLAVTAVAYARAGGMPLQRSNEDVALYRAIVESGGRFRHSYRVRVHTSARMIGRAQGGLADAIGWWNRQAIDHAAVLVECAAAAEARLARLGLWLQGHPGGVPPRELVITPEPAPPGQAAEIHATLRSLREINAGLARLPLAARLERASDRFLPPVPVREPSLRPIC